MLGAAAARKKSILGLEKTGEGVSQAPVWKKSNSHLMSYL